MRSVLAGYLDVKPGSADVRARRCTASPSSPVGRAPAFQLSLAPGRWGCLLSRTDVTSAWTWSASSGGARSGPSPTSALRARRGCGASRAAGGETRSAGSSSCGRRRRPTRRRSGSALQRSASTGSRPSRGWSLIDLPLGAEHVGSALRARSAGSRSPAPMTVGEVVKASTDFLARKDVPSPRVDAEHLVAHALGITRLDLYLQYDRPLTDEETAACRELVRRRGTREPLAYILGEWGFRRLMLNVDSRALIPRPETEVVVERCLALLDGVDAPAVLDVGTGTGAIALAIADERPDATVLGDRRLGGRPRACARERGPGGACGSRVVRAPRRRGRAAGRPVRPRRVQPAVRRARRSRHAPAGSARLGARAGARRARRDGADRRAARATSCGRTARSCSRWRTARRRRSPSCSRSSASPT